jgi:hypothetical protein
MALLSPLGWKSPLAFSYRYWCVFGVSEYWVVCKDQHWQSLAVWLQVPWVILTTQEHSLSDPLPFPKSYIFYSMGSSETPHFVISYKYFSPVHMSVLPEEPVSSLGGDPDLSPLHKFWIGFLSFTCRSQVVPYLCLCVHFWGFSQRSWIALVDLWSFYCFGTVGMDCTLVWVPSPFLARRPWMGKMFSFSVFGWSPHQLPLLIPSSFRLSSSAGSKEACVYVTCLVCVCTPLGLLRAGQS